MSFVYILYVRQRGRQRRTNVVNTEAFDAGRVERFGRKATRRMWQVSRAKSPLFNCFTLRRKKFSNVEEQNRKLVSQKSHLQFLSCRSDVVVASHSLVMATELCFDVENSLNMVSVWYCEGRTFCLHSVAMAVMAGKFGQLNLVNGCLWSIVDYVDHRDCRRLLDSGTTLS